MVGGRIREGIEGGGVVGDGVVGCGGIPRGRRRGAEHCVTILAIVSFFPVNSLMQGGGGGGE